MPTNALAPVPEMEAANALAPYAYTGNPYIQSLMARAKQEYPHIMSAHSPTVFMGVGPGFAEVWPVGETGRPDDMGRPTRPSEVALDKFGVEIRRPDKFNYRDLVGELMHVDPYAQEVSAKIAKMWTPRQLAVLKREALDYQATLEEGRPEEDAIRNATDSALRGYVVGQWPANVTARLGYTPEQRALLDSLKTYVRTGQR